MKILIKAATEGSLKRTQNMAKKFSQEEIARRREAGYRGESGEQILTNLMKDPNTRIGEPDAEGNRYIYYNDNLVGWVNYRTGMGDFTDRELYTQIKRAAKARPDYGHEWDDVEDVEDEEIEEVDEEDEEY